MKKKNLRNSAQIPLMVGLMIVASCFFAKPLSAQLIDPSDTMRDYLRMMRMEYSEDQDAPFTYLFQTGLPVKMQKKRSVMHPWSRHAYFQDVYEASSNQTFTSKTASGQTNAPRTKSSKLPSFQITPYAPSFIESENSNLAMGGNDGALWQGRGRNQLMSLGFHMDFGALKVDARPHFVFSENLEFPMHPFDPETLLPEDMKMSPMAEPLVRADLPQRFGDKTINRIDTGLFSARLEFDSFTMGVSKTSMWSGPSYENPLLLGNHAPGFWHGHVGTSTPLTTAAGGIFARLFWGQLKDSDYFIRDTEADRYVNGLMLVWQPWFAKGLEFGFHRVGIGHWPGTAGAMETWFDVFRMNPREPETVEEWESPNDDFFAKSSMSVRYAVPGAGFEFYAEYGRNDYRRSLREWFLEPEINRAHLFGFVKRFEPHPRHWFTARAELAMLENNAIASTYRPTRTWFEHPSIYGGFTHQGQTLGSSLGPGGSTQQAVLRWYHPFGMLGIRGARVVHNNDRIETYRNYYMTEFLGRWDLHAKIHMIEMNYGLEGVFFVPSAGLEIQFNVLKSRVENIYNQRQVDMNNIRTEIVVRFSPSGWIR